MRVECPESHTHTHTLGERGKIPALRRVTRAKTNRTAGATATLGPGVETTLLSQTEAGPLQQLLVAIVLANELATSKSQNL